MRKCDRYILDEKGIPVPEPNLRKWADWMDGDEERRIVKQDLVRGVKVSTVFLGLDHGRRFEGPPVLWETMVFGGPLNHEMERCSGSREQAEAMHAGMLAKVRRHPTP